MRTVLFAITAVVATLVLGSLVVLARLFRVRDRPGSIYERIPAWWSQSLLFVAGVRVRVHGEHYARVREPRVFCCNHNSWFDVFTIAATLREGTFVSKYELFKIPILGFAMRLAGIVRIERENRKAAFAAYEVAAKRIQQGTHVVVFPEGTRGFDYELRSFKKGPFVLAIAAQAPVVPTVIHGTIEIMPKKSSRIRPGTVDIHFLEPVPSVGYSYEERGVLLEAVRDRMAAALRELYGVDSRGAESSSEDGAPSPQSAVRSPA